MGFMAPANEHHRRPRFSVVPLNDPQTSCVAVAECAAVVPRAGKFDRWSCSIAGLRGSLRFCMQHSLYNIERERENVFCVIEGVLWLSKLRRRKVAKALVKTMVYVYSIWLS